MYDYEFDGADPDALALLGGGVAGIDYVGANPGTVNFDADRVRALVIQAQRPAGINPAFAQLAAKGLQAMRMQQSIQKNQKLRQAALAGLVPQVPLPISSSAVIAAGAAQTLTTQPGVPMRITKFVVAGSIAPFFGILAITAARINMIAGGGNAVPAEVFAVDAQTPPIENPILGAGAPIVLNLQNIDVADHFFLGSFFGIDLTPAAARLS